MSDLIDRQAAIDAIVAWTVEDRPDIEMPTDLVGRINALPSAQPEVLACGNGELIAQPEPQWIPCSERLPEIGQSVLLSVGGMYSAEGCLREDGNWAQFRWDAIQRKDMVGAWMPLPSPYEATPQ